MDIFFESDELREICQCEQRTIDSFGERAGPLISDGLWYLYTAQRLSDISEVPPESLLRPSQMIPFYSVAIGSIGRIRFRPMTNGGGSQEHADEAAVQSIEIMAIILEGSSHGTI